MRRWTVWTVGLAGLGAGLVVLPLVFGLEPEDGWPYDVVISVGTAALLFVPFYLLTRRLDRHIEDVRAENRANVGQLAERASHFEDDITERVSQFEQDVERRLDDVASAVRSRLMEARKADLASFDGMRTAPSREGVLNALQRAAELGLTSSRYPPRMDVAEGRYTYVSVAYYTAADVWHDPEVDAVTFRVEDMAGSIKAWIPWREGQSTEDVMVEVGRAVERECDEILDTAAVFKGLADLLDVAHSSPEQRPAVQLCPPQWVITERGIVTYERRHTYSISHRQLRDDQHIGAHVTEKTWCDAGSFDEAHTAALALFAHMYDG